MKNNSAKVRNQQIGFVFQQFFLLSKLNALQNVELPLIYAGVSASKRRKLAEEYLDKVELTERSHHYLGIIWRSKATCSYRACLGKQSFYYSSGRTDRSLGYQNRESNYAIIS